MLALAKDVLLCVFLYVPVTLVHSAKMAELIEMPFKGGIVWAHRTM